MRIPYEEPKLPVTVAPFSAISSSFHVHVIGIPPASNLDKLLIIDSATSSKWSVARASIVGPAPERHTPSSPMCVLGCKDSKTSVRPGIRLFRYGWCNLREFQLSSMNMVETLILPCLS